MSTVPTAGGVVLGGGGSEGPDYAIPPMDPGTVRMGRRRVARVVAVETATSDMDDVTRGG